MTVAARRRSGPIRALFVLEFVLIAVGVPLAGVAYVNGRHALANVGFLVLGAGAMIGGLETMITRRIHMTPEHGHGHLYQGLAAGGVGLSFVALGFGLALFGYTGAAGAERAFFALLLRRPGLVLLPVGLFLFGGGLAVVIGATQGRRSGLLRVIAILDRAPGVVLLLMGTAALAVGALELLSPALFDGIVRDVTGVTSP
jgi:hypothetical protein